MCIRDSLIDLQIGGAGLEKLRVGSIADAPAVIHDQNVRHGLDGADALGDHDGGGVSVMLKNRLAQRRVRFIIQSGGGIVQDVYKRQT